MKNIKIIQAPLAGISDTIYRELVREKSNQLSQTINLGRLNS